MSVLGLSPVKEQLWFLKTLPALTIGDSVFPLYKLTA